MATRFPVTLFIWKDQTNLIIRKMLRRTDLKYSNGTPGYDARENAENLAVLFTDAMPGNTLDVFYGEIAQEIRKMLETPEQAELLRAPYDIENRIRGAMDTLAAGARMRARKSS